MAGTSGKVETGSTSKVTGVSAIESIIKKSLYDPENLISCGPAGQGYPELSFKQPCMLLNKNVCPYIPGLDNPIPQEAFRPRMGLAIDFLHQYTLTLNLGKLKTQPIIDPTVLKSEASRLLNFKRRYLDAEPYMKMAFGNDYITADDSAAVLQDPYRTNVFLNEFLNGYLTDVSVTRNRNDIGTSTITFKTVRNYPKTNSQSTTILYNTGLSILQQLLVPMLPVRIWGRGRIFSQWYFPIYDGFIVAVNPTDAAGFAEIQITCKDILELARITQENVNPAIIDMVNIQRNDSVNILGQPFFGHDHFEIVQKIFVGGSLQYNVSGFSSYFTALFDADFNVITNPNKVFIPGLGLVDRSSAVSLAQNLITTQLRGVQNTVTSAVTAVGNFAKNIFDKATGKQTSRTDVSQGSSSDSVDVQALAPFDFVVNTDVAKAKELPGALQSKNDNIISEDSFSVPAMLSCMQRPRKVIMWGSEITPYRIFNIQSPDVFNSQFSSRLEILQQVANSVYYDFYSDGAGNIHYHPQRFANDYLTNDAMYFRKGSNVPHKVKDAWPGVQVLGPEEMTNVAVTLNYEQLVTFLILRGKDPHVGNTAQELLNLYGNATHNEYLSRFGYRRAVVENNLFNFNFSLDPDNKDIGKAKVTFGDLLAVSLLNYANAELHTASCSIIFRPEFQICKPIYFVETDTVFYATSVTHSISIGGEATTNISGSYGRKSYEVPSDLNSFMIATEGMYRFMGSTAIDPKSFIQQLPAIDWINYLGDSAARALSALENTTAVQTPLPVPPPGTRPFSGIRPGR